MVKFYTVTSAAEHLGCHKSQVSRHAARLGVGRMLGTVKILTGTDVADIARELSRPRPKREKQG